ncbi:MAG: hypothetical protein EAZ24_04495 [Burkholderiales bacterium]|nr:MAG: hypothetical protein EAZ21_08110 [Betaproteobacteria bacterium]TAG81283.1 MAG: hypothetical protein EAZ24_04495 [Burkholderiales bacterium]
MVLRTPSKEKKTQSFKSGKQRRAEIVARRRKGNPAVEWIDPLLNKDNWPKGAVAANLEALGRNNTYGLLPNYYVDKPFKCRDCGIEEVWRATQQKWYYEVAKGRIEATAARCKSCRRKERERKEKARAASLPGLLAKRMRPQS